MLDLLLLLAISISAYFGFVCLAMLQRRNLQIVTASTNAHNVRPVAYRAAGVFLLAVSFMLCIVRDGPSFGSLLWAIVISAAATAVALTLTFRARWLRWLSQWACARTT